MNRFVSAAMLAGLLGAAALPALDAQKNPVVIIDTSHGKIAVELFADKAPITVKNFMQYTDDKHYDGTIFHRVMADFMIQGGGLEPGLKEKKTRAAIKNESGISNERGTIAMARLPDPDSATSQFFINVKDNTRLDKLRYAVFGRVIDGMEVVDKIRVVETTTRVADDVKHEDVPVQDVVIRSVRRK